MRPLHASWRARLETLRERVTRWTPLLLALLPVQRAAAATLPEERADAFYHLYNGGGELVQGPALLVRKNFAETASVSAGYYVDEISSASIDVVTTASPYKEERREILGGIDYLHRDTMTSFSYTDSNEPDYKARTYDFGISQDLFDNRTTLKLGYFIGNDVVGERFTSLAAKADRAGYSVSLSQAINKTLVGTLAVEATSDDGYLKSPYRSARVLGAFVAQVYPATRNGVAAAQTFVKSWDKTWSTRLDYRYYSDSWHVRSLNAGLASTAELRKDWIAEVNYRYYHQQAASFYSDDFDAIYTYMSRDRELSHFHSYTVGGKLTMPLYQHDPAGHAVISNVSATVATDYLMFHYNDFTDVRSGNLYAFNAFVAQIYLTVRY